jgi:RNA polymerase sigma-70 factor (ECF subfamily)
MTCQAADDARLLAETAANADAFGEFYGRYEEAVLVFMLRRTSSPELAADLTAEVFAAALEGAGRFRFTGAPPAAWLFRIARNILVDSYREARVQDAVRRRLSMPPLTLTDEIAEHLDRLAARAEGEEALELLGHLPAEQRAVVVAHILDDRGYGEIATELQCSTSVVRKRVSRGLAVLRRQLRTGENHA